jgi:PAS domain S-box-containing protein
MKNKQVSSLPMLRAEMGVALTSKGDLQSLLQRCTETIVRNSGIPLAQVWTLNRLQKILALQASSRECDRIQYGEQQIDPNTSLVGKVARSRVTYRNNDVAHDSDVANREWLRNEGFVAFAGHPLIVEDRLVGVLAVWGREPLLDQLVDELQLLAPELALFVDRKEAEKSLLESEERSTLLLQASGEGVFGTDLEGRCTFANPACVRLLGYADSADLLGKSTHALFHHTRSDGAPYPHSECRIHRAIAAGAGAHSEDEMFWRRDGTSFPVEYRANAVWRDRKKIGGVVTFVDITQRRRAEEAMRLRESALRAIFQGVFITDPAHQDEPLSYVNAAFENLTGYALREVKGRDIEFLRGPETDSEVVKQVRDAYEEGRSASIEVQFYRKDGTSFWARLAVAPVTGSSGTVTHFVGILTDITERKQFEQQLLQAKEAAEAANVAKSQFLASMSHELRTPLNAVIMYSELLQEEAQDRGIHDFVADLEKIRLGGKHLLALVNNVLDLSKIEASKMELAVESFEICQMLKEVVDTIQPLAAKKANHIDLQCAPGLGQMIADITKVRQILFNLLANACKFTEKGNIVLAAAPTKVDEQDWIALTVRDTGIGMTPEQVSKIFRPFTQANALTARKYGGTGLGLSLSKHFCEMMGGEITVSSELGLGSTFCVRLPSCVRQQALAGNETETAKANVLVIDDDPSIRDYLAKSLAAEGICVSTASDGEEGLRLAREHRPAVIFLDVLMPRTDGWAVLNALKCDSILADVPVVMMTIFNEAEMGYLLGASEYLAKPIDRERLVAVLKKYCPLNSSIDVLVVEDEAATRQVIHRTLAKQGWIVAEAANGRIALEQMARHKPSFILLDLLMPEMDGFEFLTEVRKNEAWRSIPVIILTSKDLTASERNLMDGNVKKILQKGACGRESLLREMRHIVNIYAGPRAPERPMSSREVVTAREQDQPAGKKEETRRA